MDEEASAHTIAGSRGLRNIRGRLGDLRPPALADIASRFGLVVAWALMIVVFSVMRPDTFATVQNFQTLFGSQAILLVLALGLVIPLTVGEFDLSIGGVMNLSVVLMGYLNVIHGWPLGWAILTSLLVGVLVGVVNAFFILFIGVDSIIVTLGTGTLLVGMSLGINSLSIGGISETLVTAVRHQFLGIQLSFYYGLALVMILWYVLSYTPLGRYLYFVGAGREVARLAGIRVDRFRAGALIASATIAALAGVLMAGNLGATDPNVGPSFLLPAYAGAFLGATAINPGRFNPWGTFIAVYFLVTGITGLQLLGLSGWVEQVFYGGALVIAVALSRIASGQWGRRAAV